ncbi:MAG: hypothetical protein GY711_08480 [bacterium]|nr:hypothetical protein [bacterium]
MFPSTALRAFPFLLTTLPALAQEGDVEDRLHALERENAELRQQFSSLADDFEALDLGAAVGPLGDGEKGFGPGASKIYGVEHGLSIGGYGEILFEGRSGNVDRTDAQRVITYLGYKFNDQWLLNTEIELEHATTSNSSGTTSSEGSSSVEFAYLEYQHTENFGARAGLVLVPMGWINELHEPTSFLGAQRPQTERRIIPSTWRENGVGVFGSAGGFEYRAYAINGLNGEDFDASGLRGGRQKGSRAAADDIAFVGRADYVDVPGLTVGGSVYVGDSGQDGVDGTTEIPDLSTTIVELHAQYQTGPWHARALLAQAEVDDTDDFNDATGENLADELEGAYLELGYDFLAGDERGRSLTAFARIESIDTQASLASGFDADDEQDDEVITFGFAFKPIDQVVIKLDYDDWDGTGDQLNLLIGYVF